ncbi:uncharacterized protein PV09_03379 [Verruconis gallopava]|uniref:Uncharacterized protein n=1 Tax=Verruconis gallopava TaxID=253628 RepID=A0A0D1XS34_9PEZI|nr:uncharacterized protein PV09_03379 [Verruconis gallopava]KIW05496.1 hypothetical protein PV09_03379 [Verruconis gallopava]
MVRFLNTSSSERERWRYDKLDQQEAVNLVEDSHPSGSTSVEAVEGEEDSMLHGTAALIKNRFPGIRVLDPFHKAQPFGGTTLAEQETFEPWDEDEPTPAERRTLRKIADTVPYSAFLVAIVELCERFAYFGMTGPFQNYIANKYNDPSGNPGALSVLIGWI